MTPFEWMLLVLGPAGMGPGLWRIGGALYRRARAAEQLRDAVVRMLLDHEDRITVNSDRISALEHPPQAAGTT